MSQYEPSAPYDFVVFVAGIDITITPCAGFFRPSDRAEVTIILDEKPLGRPVSPGQNTVLKGTYRVDINDPTSIGKCLENLLDDGVIRPDAGMIVRAGSRNDYCLARQYPQKVIDRHSRFIGHLVDQICKRSNSPSPFK